MASLRGKIERQPSIVILYPALIDTLGDIGSILGSMETTKLALGYTKSLSGALKGALADLVSVESAAAMMHVLFGIFAFIVAYGTGLGGDPIPLVLVALGSNLVSFPFISLLSLITATQTFKRGLDPDNFVIPLVTSVSDLCATLGLVAVLMVLAI